MASFVPSKSQPLHNFELPPLLKWKKDRKPSGSHKRRRLMKSPSQCPNAPSASPPRYSPLLDYANPTPQEFPGPPSPDSPVLGGASVEHTTVCAAMKHLAVGGDSERLSFLREEAVRLSQSRGRGWPEAEASRKGKGAAIESHRNHFKISEFAFGSLTKGNCSLNSKEGKIEGKCKTTEADLAGNQKKSCFSIKIPCKNNNKEEENPTEVQLKSEINAEVEKEEKTNHNSDDNIRLWNLRPRNGKSKLEKANVGIEKGDASGKNKAQPQLRCNGNKSNGKEGKSCSEKLDKSENKEKGEKKEKKKLSINIALTKEEIEEDIFALTGSKPSRRPKRRPKNVQKQLDLAFPGLWLQSITPETYKVSESSLKIDFARKLQDICDGI